MRRSHGNSYELWPRQTALEQNQGFMGLPLSFDTPPAACGPGNACMSRPLYPHAFLLPTGEYFVCWIKCAPISSLLAYKDAPRVIVLAGALQ